MSGPVSRTIVSVFLVCASVWCSRLSAQSAGASPKPQAQTPEERALWLHAANRWRQTAIDPKSQSDTATPELRAKRNAHLQPSLEITREFRDPAPSRPGEQSVWITGPVLGDVPELSAPAHAIWVIAKFESFHVFAADPQYRLTYTEINFRVTRVLRQPPSLSLAAGALLDLESAGGSIKKPDGSIASFPIHPERHDFQPGGTYLLVGSYDSDTEYFRMDNWWDLSSGKVVPGTLIETERTHRGNSKLSGLTTTQAIQYLDSILPTDSN